MVDRRILAAALAVGLAMGFHGVAHQEWGGDTERYIAVADNLLFNRCISIDDPIAATCTPHWGGNQFPGYSAVIALVGAMIGRVPGDGNAALQIAAIITQTSLLALVLVRVGSVVERTVQSPRWAAIAVLMLGFNPITFAWSRFILTETLAVATTIWLLAELAESARIRCLRAVPLGLALAAAMFVRLDAVTLAPAVAVTAFMVHPPADAIRRGLLVAVIASLPLGAWTARNLAVGLSALPKSDYNVGLGKPQGLLDWLTTWTYRQYDGATVIDAIANRRFDRVRFPNHAYRDAGEREQVATLLARLNAHRGTEFPDDIDAEFSKLAEARRAADPVEYWLILPLRRVATLWLLPTWSGGYPIEFHNPERERLRLEGWRDLVALLADHPLPTVWRGALFGLRLALVVSTLFLLWRWPYQVPVARVMLASTAAYAVVRSIFLAELGFDEPRLMIEAYAALWLATLMACLLRSRAVPT
ncbi:MAG: hypothetical protein FJX46_01740 [Alphaproteobacteria bacterium]|nr:hypothetical protein [Alphaproteobacteria bacterium]